MTEYRVHSVALLLVNQEGLLYCVRELSPKPEIGKVPGSKDRSFPWETMEPDEFEDGTFRRLIREEVDRTDRVEFLPPVWIGDVPVYDTLAHIFLASFISGPADMRGSDTDIEPLGWRTREFLLERCRDGVPEVLQVWDKFLADLRACR